MALKTVWFWKGAPLNSNWCSVTAYSTDEHPHPSIIESDIEPTTSQPHSLCSLDDGGRLVVSFVDKQFDGIPELWFILEETSNPTDMVTVHAMGNKIFPNGTVVTPRDVSGMQLNTHDRVGHLKWFRSDSRIQQIIVSKDWRRKRISTALITVADLVIVSHGYGKFLNGGDITTPDGEELRAAWVNSSRVHRRIGSIIEGS